MCIKEIELKRQKNCKLMTSMRPYQINTTQNIKITRKNNKYFDNNYLKGKKE